MQITLLIITIAGQFYIVTAQNDTKNRPKTIAELQTEYLSSEEKLWQKIDQVLNDLNHIDVNDVNKTTLDTLKVHRNIFFGDTFESNSYWRSYLLYNIENFREFLSNINDTFNENYQYLYDDAEQIHYNPLELELWTSDKMFKRLKENSRNLFDLTVNQKDHIFQYIQTEAKCCVRYVNYVISEAQLVREYYANVGKSLLRSYAMSQLAYMLMSLSLHRNLHDVANVERKLYLEQYFEFRNVIESMLSAASLDLWKCNPAPYLDSPIYYTSITNFMQGYIDNEINLNREHNCDGTCSDFKSTENYQCQNNTLCAHQNFKRTRCSGDVFDCSTIEMNGIACLVKDEWENRRYNYVTFKNGTMNGHNVLCFKAEQTELATRSELLPIKCESCFCFCDEPDEKSDRYFSLSDVSSDIVANKIVTGITIRKINRVIQFSISERELFAFGKVNDTLRRTQIWKTNRMDFLKNGKNGYDYFTLTKEFRSINLDSVVCPMNKVMTGVRFQVNDNRLHMEIRATEFDYKSGKLQNLEKSEWINNLISEKRDEIVIDTPDSPIRTSNIQERIESNNKFIQFRSTDVKKDLAQLTVPFIESVPLEASEPQPLSGAGLYYKGEDSFGGFIAVKLISYDSRQI